MLGISIAGRDDNCSLVASLQNYEWENVGNTLSKHDMNKFLNKEMLLMLLMY